MSLGVETPRNESSHFDEAALSSGALRPEWRRLSESLDQLGEEELRKRWRQGQRLLAENGVTYNVYGDSRGIDRPWQLDPMPILVPSDEWSLIESAVVQRAKLLSEVLSDVYGRQRLLKEGALPPDFVFRHPAFLRPCHGVEVPGGNPLVIYSADLARSPDGRWRVIADRTQAPSGAGYALENRLVVSCILPELFREFPVRRLAGYFRMFRESLMALAPRNRENPRVVLLTPGPFNETYFEHAYLARYLGFPLVEGADLTVRDEHLYLKTLSGLWPVDVVLRRQDDHFCDPLELYTESALGVAGLVQAVRAGNVAIANALGSGFLETATLMAFLPDLSRRILGEDLLLPSVSTWWCGDAENLDGLMERLGELVIKPAFPGPYRDVVFGTRLDAEEKEEFRRQIVDRPHQFVAQERVALSMVPIGVAPARESRPVVLRVFAVATADGYEVMPGGLTRFSSTVDGLVVSSQAGGGSKDTWVLTDREEPFVTLLGGGNGSVDVSRDGPALTSRVADNLFWLGRMSERLEGSVRLFRTAQRGLTLCPEGTPDGALREMIDLMGRLGYVTGTGPSTGDARDIEERLLQAMFDEGSPRSLAHEAGRLHRLAWPVRDRISVDAWRVLTRLDHQFADRAPSESSPAGWALDLLDNVLITLSGFSGLVMDSTTRGLGWRFLDLGRRLERGLHVVALLRASTPEALPPDSRMPHHLLEILDCSMTYRSRYMTSVQWNLVVDLLLLDESNPRSLVFQLANIAEDLHTLRDAPAASLEEVLDRVRGTDSDDLVGKPRPPLHTLLTEVSETLLDLSDSLNHTYLSHTLTGRQPAAVGGASV